MGGLKTISIIVAANIKGLETGLGRANKSLANFASGAARMGSMLTFGITAPLVALGKSAFDTFTTFEATMIRVGAVTAATSEDFKLLEAEARRLGRTTSFTAQQFADLQLNIGRKGFNPKQIVAMEGSVANLALATGEDLSVAAKLASSQIRAWGKTTEDTTRITNTLYAATAKSDLTLGKLTTALTYASKPANDFGLTLEETVSMLGNVVNQGQRASKAGRMLSSMIAEMTKKGLTLNEALDKIEGSSNKSGTAIALFGKEAYGTALILAGSRSKVAGLTDEIRENQTALTDATDRMKNSAQYKVILFQSAIEGLKLEFGAILSEYIVPFITKLTILSQKFSELTPETKQQVVKFTAMAAAIGPVLMLSAALVAMIGMLATVVGVLLSPVVLITGALMSLGVAAAWVYANFNNLLIKIVPFIGKGLPKFLLQAVDAFSGGNNPQMKASIALMDSLFDSYGNMKKGEDGKPLIDSSTLEFKSFNDILTDTTSSLKEFAAESLGLEGLLDNEELKKFFAGFDVGTEAIQANIDKLSEWLEGFTDSTSSAADASDRFWAGQLETIATGFANVFTEQTKMVETTVDGMTQMEEVVMGFGEKFDNFVGDYLKQLGQMILKTAILAALMSVVFGGKAAGGKNFMENFKNILHGGDLFGGEYANGGNPPVGKMSLVGERGPELFVPNQAGTIIPNHALGGGGGTVIPDVRISGNDLLIVFDRAERRRNRR